MERRACAHRSGGGLGHHRVGLSLQPNPRMGDGGVFLWRFLQEHGDGVPRSGLCWGHPLALRRRSKA